MQEAAVCWVERDGKVLVVWNRRYRGWTLPGGLVGEGETPLQAMARELREETSLFAESAPVIHYAPAELLADGPKNRGSHVWVFRCDQTIGAASEQEPGCPVMWITRDEFLALCPFKRFYERMFTKLGWDYAEEVSVSQDDQVVKRALLDAAVNAGRMRRTMSNDAVMREGLRVMGRLIEDEIGPGVAFARLILLQHGRAVRFLDLTTLLCRDLTPIVESAARLGGDVADPQDAPWWDRVSTEEYRVRVERLTDDERIALSGDIRAALQGHQMIWETQKAAKAKIALQRISVRKRIIVASLRRQPPKPIKPLAVEKAVGAVEKAVGAISRATKRLERSDYQTRLLFWIGREFDARYGRETSGGVFDSARAKISDEVSAPVQAQTGKVEL